MQAYLLTNNFRKEKYDGNRCESLQYIPLKLRETEARFFVIMGDAYIEIGTHCQ